MLFKYSLIALLSFSSALVYASEYRGFYCKTATNPLIGWEAVCGDKSEGCNIDGYDCKYCSDCTIAERECKELAGELWRASNFDSWTNGDGIAFECTKGSRVDTATTEEEEFLGTYGTPGAAGSPGTAGTAGSDRYLIGGRLFAASVRGTDGHRGADGNRGADGSPGEAGSIGA